MEKDQALPEEKLKIRISVRGIVEFILKSGDLSSGWGRLDKEAMLKGSRLHRKIQQEMGSGYRAEVSLKKENEYEDLILLIEGRADGIFKDHETTVIDEIKGIHGSPDRLKEPIPVHRAQALVYAWILLSDTREESIDIQMTYGNLDTQKIRRFRETVSREELKDWYRKLVDEYHKWVSYQQKWMKIRNRSMDDLTFPFPYRPGQKKMVSSVYHTITQKQQIFIQAPTGIGKTISTIYPAVKAMGRGEINTVFYLTAKTITRSVAEEACRILRQDGMKLKTITITAKEKLCILDHPDCDPNHCPYARGHFDRINDAVFDLWTGKDSYTRETILDQAEKYRVCPFELCLDLAVWSDAVICDYNYVFDPNVQLKRFFGEGNKGKYLFLVDEAHNLVERGREMYSASISKEDVLRLKKQIKSAFPKLSRALERLNRKLLELKKECLTSTILNNTGNLSLTMLQIRGEMDKILEDPPAMENAEFFLEFYFNLCNFLNIEELIDDNYVIYAMNTENGDFLVKLFCINPAGNLGEALSKGTAAVFFSATLLPMGYYRSLLSARDQDFGIYLPSPFLKEHRRILIASDVSSKYTRRGTAEYSRIAAYLARTVWQKKGNYIVFFPSYKMLEAVYDLYEEQYSSPWVKTIMQSPAMTEREREDFLEEFRPGSSSLLAFCVMGGIFSEGIDLIGDRLIGVMVVGTGLPQVSTEKEILKNYYDQKDKDGFAYAYRYPGMNKVLQSAGRVIRTSKDKGVILLMDERFLSPGYRKLFPAEWEDAKVCSLSTVEQELKAFWTTFESEEDPENEKDN